MSYDDDDRPLPRIWETTRERMWADQWWHQGRITLESRRTDPIEDGVPIRSIAPTTGPVEPVRERSEPVVIPQLELHFFTEDGAEIEGLCVRVYDGFGFDRQVKTDGSGRLSLPVDLDAPHHVEISEIPDLAKIARLDPPQPKEGVPPLRRDDQSPHMFSPGRPYDVVIARDRAELVSLDGWHEGGAVLLFGPVRATDVDVVTARAVLRVALARRRPSGMLLVLGHTDTKGKASDNAALAKERATSVLLYLAGQRDDWAAHAFDNATVADLQAALAWAATTGISCSPGPIDNDWGPATNSGLQGLRAHAGIPAEQQLGVDDWKAIYDLYDADLARLLYCSVEQLAAIKASLTIVGDSYGENWPAIAPNKNGYLCPANRRVDLVWCDLHEEPLESFEEIYDGTYAVNALEVGPEVPIEIYCMMTEMVPLIGGIVTARVGRISAQFIADETGLVSFTALRGDTVEVLRCTDIFGACDLVAALTQDLTSVQGVGR